MTRRRRGIRSEDERYWSAGEVAEYLSVSPKTVNRWRREGRLPAHRLPSGYYRYDPAEVEDALEYQGDDALCA